MASSPGFIHLRVRSALSLLQSLIRAKHLAAWAKETGAPAVGVTDDNLFGALEMSETLAESGVQFIAGLTLTVHEPGPNAESGALALLAQSEVGYQNLMALSSEAFLEGAADSHSLPLQSVLNRAEGVICLTGGRKGLFERRAKLGRREEALSSLDQLCAAFDNRLYVEIQRHADADGRSSESVLADLAYAKGLPLVATCDARFFRPDQHATHDVLMCLAHSSYLSEADRPRAAPDQHLKSPAEMAAEYADIPEALESTVEIAQRCAYRPLKRKPILPHFDSEAGRDETSELRAQAEAGLSERLKQVTPATDLAVYRERLEYELRVIVQMGFPGYFLIVSDFIKWAKAQGIPVGPGRGSGAGSLVAWALTITDLDPIRFGLLFERFLNPERVSMPDFDVDFCQDRRGEVIDYVRRKYGADRVAQIITFGTLQARAVLRDVGRVMQLPFGQVDKLAKLVPFNAAKPPTLAEALELEPKLKEAMEADEEVGNLIATARQLEGLYRNASTHAAGVVIGDRPLNELAPLYLDPRSDMPATQYNMKWAENAGLVKFDFLGLKTLTVIEKARAFIAQKGVEVDLSRLPLDDKKTYDMLAKGDVVGVFQVESAGMRAALVDMAPDRFEDLIVLVALYRPGPMANIPTYCARKKGLEQTSYFNDALEPWLKPILEPTFGIITYQEQVMQIARDLAGYSFGEADLLRRAMGKKIRAEMEKQRVRFISGAVEKGISDADAELTFEACAKFADYGFNKSHSAPYALLTYQTAWLKANHPVEFLAASMSLDLHNTDKLAQFFLEARRLGVKVAPPDINASGADFEVHGDTIRYALGAIKGVGKPAMLAVEKARGGGAFKDLADFAEQVDSRLVNKRCLEALARAGALDPLERNRGRALAAAPMLAALAASAEDQRASGQASLFAGPAQARPVLPDAAPFSEAERLDHELDSIGFYLSGHPLDDLMAGGLRDRVVLAAQREEAAQSRSHMDMVGVVRSRVEKVSKSGSKFALVRLSDPSGEVELMVPPELLQTSRDILEPGEKLFCRVRVRRQEEEIRLSMENVRRLAEVSIGSHDALYVRLSPQVSFDQFAQFASQLQRAKAASSGQLILEIPIDGEQWVTVELKGRFPVDFGAMSALKSAPGVEQVRPAAA